MLASPAFKVLSDAGRGGPNGATTKLIVSNDTGTREMQELARGA